MGSTAVADGDFARKCIAARDVETAAHCTRRNCWKKSTPHLCRRKIRKSMFRTITIKELARVKAGLLL